MAASPLGVKVPLVVVIVMPSPPANAQPQHPDNAAAHPAAKARRQELHIFSEVRSSCHGSAGGASSDNMVGNAGEVVMRLSLNSSRQTRFSGVKARVQVDF